MTTLPRATHETAHQDLSPRDHEVAQTPRSSVTQSRSTPLTTETLRHRHYDRRSKDLEHSADKDVVRMQPVTRGTKKWDKALVTQRLGEGLYPVETDDGSHRRNRVHLKKAPETRDDTIDHVVYTPRPETDQSSQATQTAPSQPQALANDDLVKGTRGLGEH